VLSGRTWAGLLGLAALAGLAAAEAVAPRRGAASEIHHIHGLAFDRRDPATLYVATHTGLVRLRDAATPEWVGEHRFDLMGFTAHPSEPGLVYASGHPDVQTYARDRVGNLGLLVSRDGGRTWQSVALRGQADFHALALSPREGGVLYGWNVAGAPGLFKVATTTWAAERLPARGLADVLALAASPDPAGALLAGTLTGLFASRDGGQAWTALKALGTAPVTAAAFHARDARVVAAYVHRAAAGLMLSRDGGTTWEPAGYHGGADSPAAALAVGPGEHVAVATTAADVVRSGDGGRTWRTVVERGRPVGAR
jgi:photosystem II stability/assembly factor-like uncharacterized protein